MSATPSLWPDDIEIKVRPPAAILRQQAAALGPLTDGRLIGELSATQGGGQVEHLLDIVAPTLHYRARILTARHEKDLPYPVSLTAAVFRGEPRPVFPKNAGLATRLGKPELEPVVQFAPAPADGSRVAATEGEFLSLLREVLTSTDVRGLMSSLLARMNSEDEARADQPPAA